MTTDELLERVAATLRRDVAPHVDEAYAKTQAFMAAVVLGKLAAELRGEGERRAAEAAELEALYADLATMAEAVALPRPLRGALEAARRERTDAHLCRLVEQLYAERASLPDRRFTALLERIRRALRARLDRELGYSA